MFEYCDCCCVVVVVLGFCFFVLKNLLVSSYQVLEADPLPDGVGADEMDDLSVCVCVCVCVYVCVRKHGRDKREGCTRKDSNTI